MDDDERYVCVCVARLDGTDTFFLWESGGNAPDCVVLDDPGRILAFVSELAARTSRAGVLPQQPTRYDLDALETWCRSSDMAPDCPTVLNAWNLFGDLPRGELYSAADARLTSVYDKLFWGCNLPAMTPEGEHYVPTWYAAEIAALKRLLLIGLAEFRSRMRD